MTLPTPTLTATIDARGNVTIHGAPGSSSAPTKKGRRHDEHHCSLCKRTGHNAGNRNYHP